MSGLNARLVENWLDSTNERSYQMPFCQMLVGEGHRIIHSTRHSSIELGKDILTIGPDKIPCAFQLKDSARGRLTLQQYREIEAQLHQLVSLPIEHPSILKSTRWHRSFLVTNGQVEEETILAIEAYNRGNARQGNPDRQLEVIQRGDLLDKGIALGTSLWPSELDDIRILLELLAYKGNRELPKQKVHELLLDILGLRNNKLLKIKSDAVRRRITSAALLISVALKDFSQQENHFATISGWVMFCVYGIAACERYDVSLKRCAQAAIHVGLLAIKDSLISLSNEIADRKTLIEGNPLGEFVTYKARYTLLLGLQSILWFWCESEGWPSQETKDQVEIFLASGKGNIELWGEGAIPQILPYYWFLSTNSGSANAEYLLAELLCAILPKNKEKDSGLPSPYFSFDDVARYILNRAGIVPTYRDPLRGENSANHSFFIESLFHLLVRTGRKQLCKQLWPKMTEMSCSSYLPETGWEYCLLHSENGKYLETQPLLTKKWQELVQEAKSIEITVAPQAISDNYVLLALFLILFPHRACPEVIRYLGWKFDPDWFVT